MAKEHQASTWPLQTSACASRALALFSQLTKQWLQSCSTCPLPDPKYHAKHFAHIIIMFNFSNTLSPYTLLVVFICTNENERFRGTKYYVQSQDSHAGLSCFWVCDLDDQNTLLSWAALFVLWQLSVGTTTDGKGTAEKYWGWSFSLARKMGIHVKREGKVQTKVVTLLGGRIPALLGLTCDLK